ncbi:hypothetical protein BU16DRAFT_543721 [Lophium mytilinum]|uniref:Uncharacterized protein n=1 Tax=Lophium mytilinum TaxID=390894 RepID=A0A6A6QED1_9PEZI|nr:hypothetical protein BU16DRAFT_543721 [Lophium mytilinum]
MQTSSGYKTFPFVASSSFLQRRREGFGGWFIKRQSETCHGVVVDSLPSAQSIHTSWVEAACAKSDNFDGDEVEGSEVCCEVFMEARWRRSGINSSHNLTLCSGVGESKAIDCIVDGGGIGVLFYLLSMIKSINMPSFHSLFEAFVASEKNIPREIVSTSIVIPRSCSHHCRVFDLVFQHEQQHPISEQLCLVAPTIDMLTGLTGVSFSRHSGTEHHRTTRTFYIVRTESAPTLHHSSPVLLF